MSRYDAVVLGAGHNGLVCAAYLARAGMSVLVLERRDAPGGTAATEEFAPGFRSSSCFPSAELFHPRIVDDLELEGHGLQRLRPAGSVYVPLPEGDHFAVPAPPDTSRDPEWRISEALALAEARGDAGPLASSDVASCASFAAFLARVSDALAPALADPLPELEPRGASGVFDLLRMGWRLRRLGRQEMPEALRLLPMCLQDVLDERLETDALKACLAGRSLTASWLGPRSPGGALGLLYHHPAWSGGLLSPPLFVRGGPGALSDAVAAAAREAGAEIRTGCEVTGIVVDDGRAARVAVRSRSADGAEDGEELDADLVVSALDPKTTLLELVDASWLDPDVVAAVDDARARGTVGLVRLALDRLPPFPGAEGAGDRAARLLSGRIQIGARLKDLERAFDDVKYGRRPERPILEATVPTLTDPSLAPDGRHVLHVWVQHVPRTLREGSWHDAAEALGETVVERLEEHASGLSSGILHRDVTTPADLEERFGLSGGCPYHVEMALDQALYMRPIPGWYGYRMPLDDLYLCGAGAHPGGGITGLPGRNAAKRILADRRAGRKSSG